MKQVKTLLCAAVILTTQQIGSPASGAGQIESAIVLSVLPCPEDSTQSPILKIAQPTQPPDYKTNQLRWSRGNDGLLTGTFLMPAGWIHAYLETPDCWTPLIAMAVLPDRSRHFSLVMESKKVFAGTLADYDVVVAGTLPMRHLGATVDAREDVIVDDGAFYFKASKGKGRYTLTLREPGATNIYADFVVDLSTARPSQLFRRDITLQEFRTSKGVRQWWEWPKRIPNAGAASPGH